ncbi:hypothetical protein BCV69DRAFT_81330 [Microstroma glucosiphilum]|uniref:Uncharacterized protein n=1 Tax=Pseudomicrostroma glucosiphilum TaxID=1684307 RepID=A0A316U1H5_9BASI|nr:hypothetical protein BCV69DRAFT_81330 [Pseudomicrostroma glucosiphilum]PWN18303.1 hypothetical protein BCV69DRAFT_81330 [Pseudomicrostroma glucosiphilum]
MTLSPTWVPTHIIQSAEQPPCPSRSDPSSIPFCIIVLSKLSHPSRQYQRLIQLLPRAIPRQVTSGKESPKCRVRLRCGGKYGGESTGEEDLQEEFCREPRWIVMRNWEPRGGGDRRGGARQKRRVLDVALGRRRGAHSPPEIESRWKSSKKPQDSPKADLQTGRCAAGDRYQGSEVRKIRREDLCESAEGAAETGTQRTDIHVELPHFLP